MSANEVFFWILIAVFCLSLLFLIVEEDVLFNTEKDINEYSNEDNNMDNDLDKFDTMKYYCSVNIDKIYIFPGREKYINIGLIEF